MERYNTKTNLFVSKERVDENALKQIDNISELPFVSGIAVMPDVHLGMGCCVGAVVSTQGAVVPSIVGVDIGCGMIAVRTQFTKRDLEGLDLYQLRHSIERSIPLSAGRYNKKIIETAKERIYELEDMVIANYGLGSNMDRKYYDKIDSNWRLQLGSLGSGNHFIEVSLDDVDCVWLFLHSGSRGIGNKIAMGHIAIAKEQMKKYHIELADPDLSYLSEKTFEFDDYIRDLNWAQKFALLNREEMMDRVIKDFQYWIKKDVKRLETINCHHNFSQKEHHMGKEVWLTRKGAISAEKGTMGLIPGSMGTASYIVEGKGNIASFNSAPHGAGRLFSRTEARKRFTVEQLAEAMRGIEYHPTYEFLDEIPQAYKDIDVVMKDAEDLVEIKHKLRQIINIKGN